MAKKKQYKTKYIEPKELNWEEFLKIKDRYIGQTAEFNRGEVTCAGEISRLEVEAGMLICYCINCFVFRGRWQTKDPGEEMFFKSPLDRNSPFDLGSGTIKLITNIRGEAFLKMQLPRQRA